MAKLKAWYDVVELREDLRENRPLDASEFAIHLDQIPAFSYDLLWLERNLVSVANYTRQDAREFLALAARLPVRESIEAVPLDDANRALARLRRGELDGAAVLTIS